MPRIEQNDQRCGQSYAVPWTIRCVVLAGLRFVVKVFFLLNRGIGGCVSSSTRVVTYLTLLQEARHCMHFLIKSSTYDSSTFFLDFGSFARRHLKVVTGQAMNGGLNGMVE